MILKYIKKIFLPIPEEHAKGFRDAMASENLTRLIISGAALSAVELGVFITFLYIFPDAIIFPLTVILFNLLMIPLLLVIRRRPDRILFKRAVVNFCIIIYLVWSCFFSWSVRPAGSMTTTTMFLSSYMLMVYGIAIIIHLEPVWGALFFLASAGMYIGMIPYDSWGQRMIMSNVWNSLSLNIFAWITNRLIFGLRLRTFLDNRVIQDKNSELETEKRNLEIALANVKHLSGLLPICAHCKKVRDDSGYWQQVEEYVTERSEAKFSHSLCPECMKKLYPDVD